MGFFKIRIFDGEGYLALQGVPEKMFLSVKGTLLAKEHFFWDTWYIKITLKIFYYFLK